MEEQQGIIIVFCLSGADGTENHPFCGCVLSVMKNHPLQYNTAVQAV